MHRCVLCKRKAHPLDQICTHCIGAILYPPTKKGAPTHVWMTSARVWGHGAGQTDRRHALNVRVGSDSAPGAERGVRPICPPKRKFWWRGLATTAGHYSWASGRSQFATTSSRPTTSRPCTARPRPELRRVAHTTWMALLIGVLPRRGAATTRLRASRRRQFRCCG